MSKLPQLNLRIPEQHHQLIRDIAQLLRESNGDLFAASLSDWLGGLPVAPGTDISLLARVDQLEETVANLAQMITAQAMTAPAVVPTRKNDPFPETVLIDADKLNRAGNTWEDIVRTMNLRQTANGLRNAVGKWRKRQGA